MRIILIRQAQTDMTWEARCDAAGFERAVGQELLCGAKPADVRKSDASRYRVYTGTSRACVETAELLFELPEPPERTGQLDDVRLRAFRDTKKTWPPRLWRAMAILQWLLGSARQPESWRDTRRRIKGFVDRIEAEDRDCIVISRGLAMLLLKLALQRRGYCLEGGELFPRPLDRVRATKQSQHCGGCHHNCLLSDPKCQIGLNKARERNRG